MNGHDRIHLVPSRHGNDNPEQRIALALSILQHRPWAPEDSRHVAATHRGPQWTVHRADRSRPVATTITAGTPLAAD